MRHAKNKNEVRFKEQGVLLQMNLKIQEVSYWYCKLNMQYIANSLE